MKIWNFGSSQSIGYDHDSPLVGEPGVKLNPVRETSYPHLLKKKFSCELINYAVPAITYEKIYQDLSHHYREIAPEDIVLIQINTCFVTPYYWTPDGAGYNIYSPNVVLKKIPKVWQDQATEFYLEHRNVYSDWFKMMSQTFLMMELMDAAGLRPVYLTCDGDHPEGLDENEFPLFHDTFIRYKYALAHYKTINIRKLALETGFFPNPSGRHYDINIHRKLSRMIVEHENVRDK